jgi:DNA segregation ATPase FtsK/SpoIIIE, S-DNA-T family
MTNILKVINDINICINNIYRFQEDKAQLTEKIPQEEARLKENMLQEETRKQENMLLVISRLKESILQEEARKQENMLLVISRLKESILQEEARKQENMLQELERLRQQISQEEAGINRQLEETEEEIISELATFAAYTKLASQKANDEAPRKLEEEWTLQHQVLADLMSRLDGSISKDTPPRLISLPWEDSCWTPSQENENSYRPQTNGLPPSVLRVGELQQIGTLTPSQLQPQTNISIPAFVPIRAISTNSSIRMPGHIAIFSNDAQSRQAAVKAIESMALRLVSTFPVRKLQGVFIDPVGMGNSFPFKSLPKYIVGQQTYTRSDDVREQLHKLTVHIEQIIQNYLSRNFQTIEEYNAVKSSVEEAYRYLFVADFPTNFDNTSWEDLKSLLINGAKAGVYVLLHIDETLEKPRNFDYKIFEDNCTILRPSKCSDRNSPLFTTNFPNGLVANLILDQPPPNEQFNLLTAAISEAAKNIKTETVPFTDLYPPNLWSDDSRKEIRAPIGVTGARDKVEFWMGNNEDDLVVSSGLLAGKPGAGKSYTLHAIIISLAMKYAPDELEMYLLDFKEGVEFQIYVDPEQSENSDACREELDEDKALPHAKVISIESDREFGLSVLQKVQKEIEERANKFKLPGVNVSNLNDYRQKTGEKMPRLLVVIDEFQYMFQESDSITKQLNLIFEDITRRGRAFGVHLLIASQSPNVPNMSRGIYSYIDLRMAMQMDQNTASSVLAEGNTDAVDLLDKPGKIIYNSDLGKKGHNNMGQIADVSLEQRKEALKSIQSVSGEKHYKRLNPLVLFNGTRPTKLKHNGQLVRLAEMDSWLSLSDLNKQVIQEQDWLLQEFPGVAWLGEAMRIGNHTQAIFRRRPRSNILLVGTSEETVFGILGGILLSLVHCYEKAKAEFQILDLSQPTDDDENYWAEMSTNFRDNFSPYFPTTVGKRFPDKNKEVIKAENILQNAYAEFERH